MGWFAELPGSQISHRNYSSNIINMCTLLRKPSKYDPAAVLPACRNQLQQYLNEKWKGSAFPCPATTHHPNTQVFAGVPSSPIGGLKFTTWLLPLKPTARLQPHVVSAAPPSPDVSGQDHDVAHQHHSPSIPVLPQPLHKATHWGRRLWGHLTLRRKCSQWDLTNYTLQGSAPEPLLHNRGCSGQKKHSHSLAEGRREEANEWWDIYGPLLSANPLVMLCNPLGSAFHNNLGPLHIYTTLSDATAAQWWITYVIMHFRKMYFPSFALSLLLNEFTG